DLHRTFLPVSYCAPHPPIGVERFPPSAHRLPGCFRASSTPLVQRQRRLQVTHRRGAGHSQHIAFTTCSQLPAKPCVAPQLIVPCHPAVGHLIPPPVEHVQTLRGTRAIRHVLGHVACLTSLLVPCPLLGKGQAEIEQGMIVARHVPHEDPHLTV